MAYQTSEGGILFREAAKRQQDREQWASQGRGHMNFAGSHSDEAKKAWQEYRDPAGITLPSTYADRFCDGFDAAIKMMKDASS